MSSPTGGNTADHPETDSISLHFLFAWSIIWSKLVHMDPDVFSPNLYPFFAEEGGPSSLPKLALFTSLEILYAVVCVCVEHLGLRSPLACLLDQYSRVLFELAQN